MPLNPEPSPATGPIDAPTIRIVGLGLVTPLGRSAWETYRALLLGRTLADRSRQLARQGVCDLDPVALVRAAGAVSLARHVADDPAVELAELAARQALADARIPEHLWPRIPVYLGTSKAATTTLQSDSRFPISDGRWPPAGSERPSQRPAVGSSGHRYSAIGDPSLCLALGHHAYLALRLRQRMNLGPVVHHVAACASSLTALHHARQALLHNDLPAPPKPDRSGGSGPDSPLLKPGPSGPDRIPPASDPAPRHVLVLTAEASLTPLFIHSYRRLGVLADTSHPDRYIARPLDRQRLGFMLSELAAAVVLERTDPRCDPPAPAATSARCGPTDSSARRDRFSDHRPRHAPRLLHTALASEAHDLIRPAPGMPALRRVADLLLDHLPLDHPVLDLLHPHATGTPDNDAAELAVYHQALAARFRSIHPSLPIAQSARRDRFSDHRPPPDPLHPLHPVHHAYPALYACKGALGHGLGAAGLVSLVLACLIARARRIPPMPWLELPIDSPLLPSHGPIAHPRLPTASIGDCSGGASEDAPAGRRYPGGETHAVFAAGFGGHVAGALIQQP